ncbi:HTH_Tnp_Tc3_2 domain-containing protein [Trichonephila clavipes]|nr:HTH_Tnp_Tc3_2 domain-containing protein [Trichonephila clavipes]
MDVTPQTVRNYLYGNRFKARTARKKPYTRISKKSEVQTLEFARKYANKPVEIFVDESKFNLFGCDGKIIVHRKHDAELKERNMVSTVKHGGGGIMV